MKSELFWTFPMLNLHTHTHAHKTWKTEQLKPKLLTQQLQHCQVANNPDKASDRQHIQEWFWGGSKVPLWGIWGGFYSCHCRMCRYVCPSGAPFYQISLGGGGPEHLPSLPLLTLRLWQQKQTNLTFWFKSGWTQSVWVIGVKTSEQLKKKEQMWFNQNCSDFGRKSCRTPSTKYVYGALQVTSHHR